MVDPDGCDVCRTWQAYCKDCFARFMKEAEEEDPPRRNEREAFSEPTSKKMHERLSDLLQDPNGSIRELFFPGPGVTTLDPED